MKELPGAKIDRNRAEITGVKEAIKAKIDKSSAELRLPIERNHSEMLLKLNDLDGRISRLENERGIVQ